MPDTAPPRRSLSSWLADIAPAAALALRASAVRGGGPWPEDVVQVLLPLAAVDELLREVDVATPWPELHRFAPRRLRAFVAGRLGAEFALAAAGAEVAFIARGDAGEPLWPAGWCGSIAHTDHDAIAIVARADAAGALGIDIESAASPDSTDAILSVCLTAAERARVRASGAGAHGQATLLFSAKEAYYKAVHSLVRRFVDFDEIEIRLAGDDSFTVRPLQPLGDLPRLDGRYVARRGQWVTYVRRPPAG